MFEMWPSSTSSSSNPGGTPYRPFESTFDDFRANPFPSPEPPVPPPTSLSLSPPPPPVSLPGSSGGEPLPEGGRSSAEGRSNNNTWDALSPPADDKGIVVTGETPNVVVVTVADLVESVS